MLQRMRAMPQLTDLSTDQQDRGLEAVLVIDRDTAARFGISAQTIDNHALRCLRASARSRRCTMQLNQYHVVMEVAPQFWQSPEALKTSMFVRPAARRCRSAPSRTSRRAPPRSPSITRDNSGHHAVIQSRAREQCSAMRCKRWRRPGARSGYQPRFRLVFKAPRKPSRIPLANQTAAHSGRVPDGLHRARRAL